MACYIVPAIFLLCYLFLVLQGFFLLPFGSFGTNDFIEYWSAFQLFSQGLNPYDPDLLFALERGLGWSEDKPLMMWNPPWLLLLLAPVLQYPFAYAAPLWLGVNLFLLLFCVLWTLELIGLEIRTRYVLWSVLACALFYPLWSCLLLGQVGVLLSFAALGLNRFLKRGQTWRAALMLVLLTLKVHLFAFVFEFLLWQSMRQRQLSLVAKSLLIFGGLVSATFLIHPQVLGFWLSSLAQDSAQGNVISVMQWRTATLVDVVRSAFAENAAEIPLWPVAVIPGLAAIGYWLWLVRRKQQHSVVEDMFFATALSATFTPFGWIFDYVTLLPLFLVAVLMWPRAANSRHKLCACSFMLLMTVTLIFSFTPHIPHHYFFWVPAGILVLYLLFRDSFTTSFATTLV